METDSRDWRDGMKRAFKWVPIAVGLALVLGGCAGRVVEVMDPDEEEHRRGDWNDSDARAVVAELVPHCLASVWIDSFHRAHGASAKPRVVVGEFETHESGEHIDEAHIIDEIRSYLVNSGRVEFVADEGIRDALIEELRHQDSLAANRGAAAVFEKGIAGADFMMMGKLTVQTDVGARKEIRSYKVTLELWDIGNWKLVWTKPATRRHLIRDSKIRR